MQENTKIVNRMFFVRTRSTVLVSDNRDSQIFLFFLFYLSSVNPFSFSNHPWYPISACIFSVISAKLSQIRLLSLNLVRSCIPFLSFHSKRSIRILNQRSTKHRAHLYFATHIVADLYRALLQIRTTQCQSSRRARIARIIVNYI